MRPIVKLAIPIVLSSILLVLGIVAETAFTINFFHLEDEQEIIADELKTTRAVLIGLIDAETGQRGFLITGDERYLEPYSEGLRIIEKSLSKLRTYGVRDPALGQALDKLQELKNKKLEVLDQSIKLRKSAGFEEAQKVVASNAGKLYMDQMRVILNDMLEKQQIHRASIDEQNRNNMAYLLSLGIAIVSIVIAISIYGLIITSRALLERKRIEDSLLEINGQLQLFIKNSPVALVMVDREMRYLAYSPRWAADFGLGDQNLVGKSHYEIFPEIPERWKALHRRALAGEFLGCEEDPFEREDGTTQWINWQIWPWRKSDGSVGGFVLSSEDVTARKLAEISYQKAAEEIADLYNHAPCGYHSLDKNGIIQKINDTELSWLGYSREELVGKKKWTELIAPDSLALFEKNFPTFLKQGVLEDLVFEIKRKDGSVFEVLANATAITDESGNFLMSRTVLTDITERRRIEKEREQYYRFFQLSTDVMAIADIAGTGHFKTINPVMGKLLGYSEAELLSQPLVNFIVPEDREKTAVELALQINERPSLNFENRYVGKNGQVVLLSWTAYFDKNDGLAYASGRDITERRKAENALKLAATVLENASEAVMVSDRDNNIISVNKAFSASTGYAEDEVIGQKTSILHSGRQDKDFYKAMWDTLTRTGKWSGELWNRRKNGEIYPVWNSIGTVYDENGSVSRRVCLSADITEKKKAEEIIWQQANYDTVTKLPNRRLVYERLEQEIKKASRNQSHLALMFIDLDHFKEVNDSLGHEKGDMLLEEVAQRMLSCVREVDTVGRLGGDEFIVLLSDVQDDKAVSRIANELLEKLATSFRLGDALANISGSIGITLYPDDAEDASSLIKNADHAMYVAKESGRNRFAFYAPDNQ